MEFLFSEFELNNGVISADNQNEEVLATDVSLVDLNKRKSLIFI